jgi:pyruvate-formate lyase-activating enzyme
MSGLIDAGRRTAHRAWEHLIAHPWWRWLVTRQAYVAVRMLLQPPPWEDARHTPLRLLNLYVQRIENGLTRTRLWSKPSRLIVEATNICNLRCPACFTGAGEVGRERSHMSLELFERLLDEIGRYLFHVEFYNWGEPLLAKNIYPMIEAAARWGISTTVSTNLSFPFSDADAERLVRSGLTVLGVSIDGARQEAYAQYRVRGSLELVLENCRRIRDAKRRLGATRPRVFWEFHAFPHNVQDVPLARQLAAELDMHISVSPGWVIDSDWEGGDVLDYPIEPQPFPCPFLWGTAVVNNDGGVAPCCGTFYREDDCGQVAAGPGKPGAATLAEVWNNDQFALARRFYAAREGTPEERQHVCFDCPTTILYEDYRKHLHGGGSWMDYRVPFRTNAAYNYFWRRRPPRATVAARRRAGAA